MKNLVIVVLVIAVSLSLLSTTKVENISVNLDTKDVISDSENANSFETPDNIQAIIDNSCYACHDNESKSTKSKKKLNFDKLNDLKVSKQISKLMKITKVVRKGKMPIQKYIDKYPDRKLTSDEAVSLSSWAANSAEKLAGE